MKNALGDAALAGTLTFLVVSNWQGETWYYVPVASVFWFLVALTVNAVPRGGWEPPVISPGAAAATIVITAVGLLIYV